MVECSFKFEHFKDAIKRFLKAGYTFSTFDGLSRQQKRKKIFLLRHDIDYSMLRALEFARIEISLGIKATYFVRLHSRDYNPFEFKTYVKLREIAKLGHELGLHFEAMDISHITKEDEIEVFKREKIILENIIGQPVYTAAQHGDFTGISRNWNNHFFTKYTMSQAGIKNHTAEARFRKDFKYLSDTFQQWREGCFCKYLNKVDKLHVVIHPWGWYYKYYHIY